MIATALIAIVVFVVAGFWLAYLVHKSLNDKD